MENLNIIKEQVAKVITYSQNIEEPKVNWLINNWFKAKSNFITMFGGLIYEGPQMTFKLNETDKLKEFYEFCQYIENQYNNKDLNDFIYLNNEDNELGYNNSGLYKFQGVVYCLDTWFLDVAIQEIGEERLKKYLRGE